MPVSSENSLIKPVCSKLYDQSITGGCPYVTFLACRPDFVHTLVDEKMYIRFKNNLVVIYTERIRMILGENRKWYRPQYRLISTANKALNVISDSNYIGPNEYVLTMYFIGAFVYIESQLFECGI